MKRGRPSLYNAKIAREVCFAIATSSKGLRAICKELGINPDTVYAWVHDHPEFSEQYARAREFQCQCLADEIVELADTSRLGEIVTLRKDAKKGRTVKETRTADMVERSRLQIDARKWVLAKLLPRKYGEFERTEVTGANGGPLQVAWYEQMIESRRRRLGELDGKSFPSVC